MLLLCLGPCAQAYITARTKKPGRGAKKFGHFFALEAKVAQSHLMEPTSTKQFSSYARSGRRRPRVRIIDSAQLIGHWGFAPHGELAVHARGRLSLKPDGVAHWIPPLGSGGQIRAGRWTIEGSHLLMALDGGPVFDGPLVMLEGRMLWGPGIWQRLPPLLRRRTRQVPRPGHYVRPRARGTRRAQRRYAPTIAALGASAAALLMALALGLPM